ncbi:13177_t:CDS:2, partial [Racocetra persica]
ARKSAIIILPWVRRLGGVPDMTPEFFLNLEEQGFLTRDSGSITALGSLWWKGAIDDDSKNIYKNPVKKKQATFVEQVFRGGGAPASIDLYLTITSVQQVQQHDYKWEGFVMNSMNSVLFLKDNGLNVVELKESIVAVLELAEECLKCNSVVVCLDKKSPHLSTLIRGFLYVGFELVMPGTFNHNSNDFLLVGMEL